jgi:hypothetical protein
MISNAKIAFNLASGTADCIGVFDSGVGGLSVLKALHQRLPMAQKIYVGDVAYAPYGERPAHAANGGSNFSSRKARGSS